MTETARPFARRRRPADPREEARQALAQCLSQTNRQIAQAYQGFNAVQDPDLIESYVYEINSLQSRYAYLLRQMKELEG